MADHDGNQQRTPNATGRRRDLGSIVIGLAVVMLLAIGGSGQSPASRAAAPPAERVSHGAAGTARNGIGGSIAASPTMASWPGTGVGRNGGPFAFIGAQYGSLWSIPAMANNSLGVGYCVMEDISGEGTVSLRPDPPAWDAGETARAAALMSSFGGDQVVPYGIDASGPYDVATGEWQHPLLFGAGEYTRRRHVAVNFGVKMFVEDVSPSGVATGRKLARDTAVVDGSGDNFPALRDGYTVARRLADVAEIQHAVGGVHLELRWGTADGEAPPAPGTYPLEVRVTDATGKPVGFVPVVQLSDAGVGDGRSIGALAALDPSASTADDVARSTAASATGWPTMDMVTRLVDDDAYLVGTAPASAGVTDAAGIVRFHVVIDRPEWELAFLAQAPTSDVSLYAGTGIQGQITWAGAPQSAIVHEVAPPMPTGTLRVRKLLDPADIGTGRDLSGFEFTVAAVADTGTAAGDETDEVVVRTDASGVTPPIELPVGRYWVVERTTPDWAAEFVDGGPTEVDVDAGGTVVEAVYTNAEPVASITTAARDGADGDQMIDLTQGDATIIDSVAYRGLVPGTEYVAVGELMRRTDPPSADGAAADDGANADDGDDADDGHGGADGVDSTGIVMAPTGVVGSTTFVAEASSGTVDVSFMVPADSPLLGHADVVFQRIEVRSSGRAVATHHDATAVEQTVWFPFMSTTLMADGTTEHGDAPSDRVDATAATPVAPGDALVDLVAVFGLRPDRRYRSDLTLHRRLDDGTCQATDRTASVTVDATVGVGDGDGVGDEPTTFAVRGVTAPEPGVYVAFQVLSILDDDGGERVVARHADCNSVSQRVEVVARPVTSTTTTTITAPTTTVPATTGPTTTAAAVIHPGTSVATTAHPTTTRPPNPTTTVSPRPLPRTGTDAGTTLAVAGLALLLVGVGISSLVRRPGDPHGRNPHARHPHGRRPSA
jgi:hypothetical protein